MAKKEVEETKVEEAPVEELKVEEVPETTEEPKENSETYLLKYVPKKDYDELKEKYKNSIWFIVDGDGAPMLFTHVGFKFWAKYINIPWTDEQRQNGEPNLMVVTEGLIWPKNLDVENIGGGYIEQLAEAILIKSGVTVNRPSIFQA